MPPLILIEEEEEYEDEQEDCDESDQDISGEEWKDAP